MQPEDNEAALLTFLNVGKTFSTQAGGKNVALTDVDLTIRRGEFVSLVGPSGCGKTTLMKIGAGLLRHTYGTVKFEGRFAKPPPEKMGIVFQTATLLPWLTVTDNIIFPAVIRRKSLREAHVRAKELLTLLGLSDKSDRYPMELSGGMQQRVSIARALLLSPEVVFMDEPFGALDAMTRETLNQELQAIHQKYQMTILFVTHSIPEAIFLSDRVAVMSAGPGRIVDVIDIDYPRPRTLAMLGNSSSHATEAQIRDIFSLAGNKQRIETRYAQ